MKPLGLTAYRPAKEIHIPVTRIHAIITEHSDVTEDTPLRLARYFDTTPEFWVNPQSAFELDRAPDALTP